MQQLWDRGVAGAKHPSAAKQTLAATLGLPDSVVADLDLLQLAAPAEQRGAALHHLCLKEEVRAVWEGDPVGGRAKLAAAGLLGTPKQVLTAAVASHGLQAVLECLTAGAAPPAPPLPPPPSLPPDVVFDPTSATWVFAAQ